MNETPSGYPYPTGTDPVREGDNALRQIAEMLDARMGEYAVLPTSTNGDIGRFGEILLTADNTDTWLELPGVFSHGFRQYRMTFHFDGGGESYAPLAFQYYKGNTPDESQYYYTRAFAGWGGNSSVAGWYPGRKTAGWLCAESYPSVFGEARFWDPESSGIVTVAQTICQSIDGWGIKGTAGCGIQRMFAAVEDGIRLSRNSGNTFGWGTGATGWVKVFGQ